MRKAFSEALGLFAALAVLFAGSAHAGDTVYYYYNDAQGSPVAVTDANGTVIERTQYAPYGQVLNRAEHDGPGYTKHEEDAATGLTNMQQRYDDKIIGRMLSVDPVDVDTTTGANFNRYWYANDNPYRFVDPDGRESGAGYATGEYAPVGTIDEDRWSSFVSTVADALDTLNALPPDTGGPELHAVIAPAIAELRVDAKVAETLGDAAKISGKAQVTREAGKETMHAATSARIAGEQAARADAKSVHLNQTIGTATGGEVKSSLRPDVQTVRTDGKVDVHEVLSPGQDAGASAAKYNNALGGKAGEVKCVSQDKC